MFSVTRLLSVNVILIGCLSSVVMCLAMTQMTPAVIARRRLTSMFLVFLGLFVGSTWNFRRLLVWIIIIVVENQIVSRTVILNVKKNQYTSTYTNMLKENAHQKLHFLIERDYFRKILLL